ncbi:MAG: type I-C CRISPR-associated protein Cas5 [Actinobacteria bacterium]|nr:type I-C CRISPR-associated protein Cas5 [Actinomycetota bacterium]
MQSQQGKVGVEVFGEYACFSRPEFKVERISYPVITPSAARGVLEAIFWKPEFRYEIRRIGIIRLGKQISLMRNEIDRRQANTPILVEACRQQRTSLILKDVAYLIEAEINVKIDVSGSLAKYIEQFNRRVERGQYHHTPYLGNREFPAFFSAPINKPISLNCDIGNMLFDIAYIEDESMEEIEFIKHERYGSRKVKGYTKALFFNACIRDGWLDVPQDKYEEVYMLERRDDDARGA